MGDYSDAGIIAGLEKLLLEAHQREEALRWEVEQCRRLLAGVERQRDRHRDRVDRHRFLSHDLLHERDEALLWVPEEEQKGLRALWEKQRRVRARNRDEAGKRYAEERNSES